ncbi:MAG: hypothetical protein ACP5VE_07795 [Chthonomonadales bacterium]
MDPSVPDGLAHMTSPVPSLGLRGPTPFEVPDPESLVFVCFFRDRQDRARFTATLRQAIGRAALKPAEAPSREECAARFRDACAHAQSLEALLAVIQWWTTLSPRGIHLYNLALDYPPFRASSLVSFQELRNEEVRANAERALEMMDEERGRVANFFHWGGRADIEP